MIEIGRLCIKTAGRDSGLKCVIIDILDEKTAVVDGQTRRKKVNVLHLEPTRQRIGIKKGASRADVVKEFKKIGIEIGETKPKKPTQRPRKQRKSKRKAAPEEKAGEKKK